jgi:hypothetical protein
MVRSIRARVGVALSFGLLLMGARAAPASAAVHVRWVDNDSKSGDGPRACDTAHFHTIQAAIDASGPGDTIHVCPGKYAEQLDITTPGLTIVSTPMRAATIVAPAGADLEALVGIESDHVSFNGFKMVIPSDSSDAPGCSPVFAAIWALGVDESIVGNAINAKGDLSLSGDCGYYYGIVVATIDESAGGTWGADTSYIAHNRVTDFKAGGILLAGDRSARIYRNAIRFIHQNDPATCLLTPVLGVRNAENLLFPCDPPAPVKAPDVMGVGVPFDNVGIGDLQGLADLRGNSVYSIFDLSVCEGGPCTDFLGVGVGMFAATPGSDVRNTNVTNTFIGVAVSDSSSIGPCVSACALPPAPGGVQVSGNRSNEGYIGVLADSSNGVYYANRAHLNIEGAIADMGGNTFISNDFRYNYDYDCDDETTGGTGTDGTDNDWSAPNFGLDNNPSDICIQIGI